MQIIRQIWESLLMAVQTVTVNRMRAMLSLLGITIGIFSIIAVYTVVDSLEINIRESVNSLGSDVIYIEKWPWAPAEGEEYAWWKYMNRPLATLDEYEFLSDRLRYAESVCFMSGVGRRIEYGNNNIEGATIFGVSSEFQEIRSFEVASGRYFNDLEYKSGRNVVVIGSDIADDLFKDEDPVGKYIELMGRKVTVVGVLEKEGKGGIDAFILDEIAILPLNFYKGFIDIRREFSNPQIWVKAKKRVSVEELTYEIKQSLRAFRRLKPSEEDNFALNQTSVINNQLDQFFSVLKIAGTLIGLFSIIVGGFGIANIMFVSVKERTHIIGIQKALGAKRYTILFQFLFESIILSLAGGMIGLAIVFLGASMITLTGDFKIVLTMGNILTGLGIATFIGLFSGIIPAWQGARMDPVVAINTSF